ncbi:MAG: M1 family metallopeptidase [Kofleriaceae bacterium]
MTRLFVLLALVACGAHDEAAPAPSKAPTGDAANAKSNEPTGDVIAAKPGLSTKGLTPPTIRLPDDATPTSYDLHLDLDADSVTFSGSIAIHIKLNKATDHIWINADGLAFATSTWDDGDATLEVTPGLVAVKFGKTVQPRDLTIHLTYSGTMVHDEEGLFRQKLDNQWFLYSQGESEFARRYAPSFDEPRFKTPWRISVSAPTKQLVASNMPIVSDTPVPSAHVTHHEVTFAETPPIPSYLVAVAVGPFAVVEQGTVGKNKVPLRTLTFPKRAGAVGPVARQTGKLVALLEQYTDIPLPFPKLDIVTVPHFFGAMENPGLITFDSDIVFDGDRRYAIIAAHELAHQWFGNLVTPVWWDDLWLSEAFASWAGEKVAAKNEGHPPSEMHVAFTRENALVADGDAYAQALHRKVTFDPDNAFDSIAYDKGEAVLAMFEGWIGEDPFRTAIRAYLAAHSRGSVTTQDLVSAIATAATPEAGDALKAYVDHAGPPVVELSLSCEGAPKLLGHARDHLKIPTCIRQDKKKICALVGDSTEIPLEGTACPQLVASGGGYYNVVWTSGDPRGPLPAWTTLGMSDKLALGVDLAAATARGDISASTAIAQLHELAANKDGYARVAAIGIAAALDPWVTGDRAPWETWLAKEFASSFASKRGMLDMRIRATLLSMLSPERIPASVRDGARATVAKAIAKPAFDEGIAELVVVAGPDHATFEKFAKVAHANVDEDQRIAAMIAMGGFPAAEIPNAVTEMLALLPAKGPWGIANGYFERSATRLAIWRALAPHVTELAAKMTNVQLGELLDATSQLCDARDEVKAAFDPIASKILDGRARIDHAVAAIDRCILRRQKAGSFTAQLPTP